MTLESDAEHHNSDRPEQLSLLSSKELARLRRPSASRLWEGKKSPFKADGTRKARCRKDDAVQLRLPGV